MRETHRSGTEPMRERLHLQPGTLWPAVVRQTEHALRCGALCPIETVQEAIEDGGIRFLVRSMSSLASKEQLRRERQDKAAGGGAESNPFLPYDPGLFVADVSDTHIALLNKFNVIDGHLLIITRRFEQQEALLDLPDFEALAACMAEFEGLGFYNGGTVAGASQPHKHLQIVPLPLADQGPPLPIEPLLASVRAEGPIGILPGLPFLHGFMRLDPALANRPQLAAQNAFERYDALLDAFGLRGAEVDGEVRQSAPYNLLLTRQWMLLVPRSVEFVDGISVNALGFAGSLFVRNEEQMRLIRAIGPIAVLRRAAIAAPK